MNSRDRARDIGTRNFTSKGRNFDESSDEEEQEEYSIDPSVHLWKSIDFGTKKQTELSSRNVHKRGRKLHKYSHSLDAVSRPI